MGSEADDQRAALPARLRLIWDHPIMELAAAATVWITFSAWLFLPTVNAPARFSRIALWLCGAELLAAAIWSYGSAGCLQRPCAPVVEAARGAAALDIPFLTGVAIVLGWAYAMRSVRRPARTPSGNQDDLADVAALGDEAVRVGRPVEREGLGDDGLQLPVLEQR
jgi:hypothetical protein